MRAKQSNLRRLFGYATVFVLALVLTLGVCLSNGSFASASDFSMSETEYPIGTTGLVKEWTIPASIMNSESFVVEGNGANLRRTQRTGTSAYIRARKVSAGQEIKFYTYVSLPDEFAALNCPVKITMTYTIASYANISATNDDNGSMTNNSRKTSSVTASVLAMRNKPANESVVSLKEAKTLSTNGNYATHTLSGYTIMGQNQFLRLGFSGYASEEISNTATSANQMTFGISDISIKAEVYTDGEGPTITPDIYGDNTPPLPSGGSAYDRFNGYYMDKLGEVKCDVENVGDSQALGQFTSYIQNPTADSAKTIKFIVWDKFAGTGDIKFGGLTLAVNNDGTQKTVTRDEWKDKLVSSGYNLQGIQSITTQAFGFKPGATSGVYRGVRVQVQYDGKYFSKIETGDKVYGGIYNLSYLNGNQKTVDFEGIEASVTANEYIYTIEEKYVFNADSTFAYVKNGVTSTGTFTLADSVYTLNYDNGFIDVFNSTGSEPTTGVSGEKIFSIQNSEIIRIERGANVFSHEVGGETLTGTFTETEYRDMLPKLYSIQAVDLNGESSGSITSVMLGGIDRTAPNAATLAMDFSSNYNSETGWFTGKSVNFKATISQADPMQNVNYSYSLFRSDVADIEGEEVALTNNAIVPSLNGKLYALTDLVSGYYTIKLTSVDSSGNVAPIQSCKFKIDSSDTNAIFNVVESVKSNGVDYKGATVRNPIVVKLRAFSSFSGVVYEYRELGGVWAVMTNGVDGYNAATHTFTFDETLGDNINKTYQFRIRTISGSIIFGSNDSVAINFESRQPGDVYSVYLDRYTQNNPYLGVLPLTNILFEIDGANSSDISLVEYKVGIDGTVRTANYNLAAGAAIGDFYFYETGESYARFNTKKTVYIRSQDKTGTYSGWSETDIWVDAPKLLIEFTINDNERVYNNTNSTANDISYTLYNNADGLKRQVINTVINTNTVLNFAADSVVYINNVTTTLSENGLLSSELFQWVSADANGVTVKAKKTLENVVVSNFGALTAKPSDIFKEEFVTLKANETITINYKEGDVIYIGNTKLNALTSVNIQQTKLRWVSSTESTVTLKANTAISNLRIANFKLTLQSQFASVDAGQNVAIALAPVNGAQYMVLEGAGQENAVITLITKKVTGLDFDVNYDVTDIGAALGAKNIEKAKLVVMAQKSGSEWTDVTAPSKQYDGTTALTVLDTYGNNATFACNSFVFGEQWKNFTWTGTFAFLDKEVALENGVEQFKPINISSIAFSGNGYSQTNYLIVYRNANGEFVEINNNTPAVAKAKITRRELAVNTEILTPLDKEYDGTSLATMSAESSVQLIGLTPTTGIVAGDEVLINMEGTVFFVRYDSATKTWVKDATASADRKAVMVELSTLGGAQAHNYFIKSNYQILEGDNGAFINFKNLKIDKLIAPSREYIDGNSTVTDLNEISVALSGAIAADEIKFNISEAIYGDIEGETFVPKTQIGWHKVRIAYAYSSKNNAIANYKLLDYNNQNILSSGYIYAAATAEIQRNALQVSVSVNDKVYDGTNAVLGDGLALNPTISISGLAGAYVGVIPVGGTGTVSIAGSSNKVNIPYIYFVDKNVNQLASGEVGTVDVVFVLGKFVPYTEGDTRRRYAIPSGINADGIPNACFGSSNLDDEVYLSGEGTYVLDLPIYNSVGADVSENYSVPWMVVYRQDVDAGILGAKITKKSATLAITGLNDTNVNANTNALEIIYGNYYKNANGKLVKRGVNNPTVEYGVLEQDKEGFNPTIKFAYSAELNASTNAGNGYVISIDTINHRNYSFAPEDMTSLSFNVVKKDIILTVPEQVIIFQSTRGTVFGLDFEGLENGDTVNSLIGKNTASKPTYTLYKNGVLASTFPTASTLLPGLYDIQILFGAELANYNITVGGTDYSMPEEGNGLTVIRANGFRVNKSVLDDIEFNDKTATYDKTNKTIVISSIKTLPADAVVTYTIYDSFYPNDEHVVTTFTQGQTGQGVKNIGHYRVVVTIESEEYATYTAKADLFITAATVTLDLANKDMNIPYDGATHGYYNLTDKGVLAISSDLINLSNVELEYSTSLSFGTIMKTMPKEVGVYYVRAKLKRTAQSDNIICNPSKPRSIRISAAEVRISITSPKSYIYENCFAKDGEWYTDPVSEDYIYQAITFATAEGFEGLMESIYIEYGYVDDEGKRYYSTDAPTDPGSYPFSIKFVEGANKANSYYLSGELTGDLVIANKNIEVVGDDVNSGATVEVITGSLPLDNLSYVLMLNNIQFASNSAEAKAFNVALLNNAGVLRGEYAVSKLYQTELFKSYKTGDKESVELESKLKVSYKTNAKLGKNQKLVRIDIINAETGATNLVVLETTYNSSTGELSFETDKLGYFAIVETSAFSIDDSSMLMIIIGGVISVLFIITMICVLVSGRNKKKFQRYLAKATETYNTNYAEPTTYDNSNTSSDVSQYGNDYPSDDDDTNSEV